MRAQDQKLSRPPEPTRPARGRVLGERTLEGVVRRLQLQKGCPLKVQNVGNQKTHNPPVLCALLAFETETRLVHGTGPFEHTSWHWPGLVNATIAMMACLIVTFDRNCRETRRALNQLKLPGRG